MTRTRGALIWAALALAVLGPVAIAAQSPLLAWRDPIYIAAGFSGIVGLALLLVQPLAIAGALPGVPARRVHVWSGGALVLAVVLHVAGLWITSPPDVIDVLLFRSPTPFGVWGAIAMWAVLAAAVLAMGRARLGPRVWRLGHSVAVTLAVAGTIAHAWLIEGAMGPVSKAALCLVVAAALAWVLRRRRVWRVIRSPRAGQASLRSRTGNQSSRRR